MWRKYVMISVACVFGVILLTHSAWATDPTLTEEFKTEWQAAQDSLVGKWVKIMVYDEYPYEDQHWRVCELIIEEGGFIKRGKYVELNGDTTQITGGQLVYCPGVAICGKLVTKEGDEIIVERGGIVGKQMILGLYAGTVDQLVREDLENDLQMLSMTDLNAKSVRNFLARHRVSVDSAFPNMTIDQP